MLETLIIPISRQTEKLIQTNEKLAEWSAFHGWNDTVDPAVVAQQAALGLVLRALLCRRLAPETLPDDALPDLIVAQSQELLQYLGLMPLPLSYLDDVVTQAEVKVDMLAIDHLGETLSKQRADPIGEFYAKSVPQDARRPLGQFWTPLPIAELMTQWAIRPSSDRMLDPAFGSGIFLLTAIQRLGQLGVASGTSFRQIAGVELSPLAMLMGLTNVLLHYPTARPRLRCGDFLVPEREPLAVLEEPTAPYRVGGQQLTLPGMEVRIPLAFPDRFDAILCNPPYTRHHHLPESYKSTWTALMKQEYGLRLSRFSSLFATFSSRLPACWRPPVEWRSSHPPLYSRPPTVSRSKRSFANNCACGPSSPLMSRYPSLREWTQRPASRLWREPTQSGQRHIWSRMSRYANGPAWRQYCVPLSKTTSFRMSRAPATKLPSPTWKHDENGRS